MGEQETSTRGTMPLYHCALRATRQTPHTRKTGNACGVERQAIARLHRDAATLRYGAGAVREPASRRYPGRSSRVWRGSDR